MFTYRWIMDYRIINTNQNRHFISCLTTILCRNIIFTLKNLCLCVPQNFISHSISSFCTRVCTHTLNPLPAVCHQQTNLTQHHTNKTEGTPAKKRWRKFWVELNRHTVNLCTFWIHLCHSSLDFHLTTKQTHQSFHLLPCNE